MNISKFVKKTTANVICHLSSVICHLSFVKFVSAVLVGALLASNSAFSILNSQFSINKPVYAAASYQTNFRADKAQASRGENVTYELILTNNGDSALTNFNVYQITRPQNTSYVNGSGILTVGSTNYDIPDAWFSDPVGTNLGGLTPGQAMTFKWSVKVDDNAPQTAVITESVAVKTAELGDPNIYPVNFTVAINASRNSICATKTIDKSSANVGDTVTYSIRVCNDGDIDQDNVTLYDRLPSQLTYKTGTTRATVGSSTVTVNDNWIGSTAGGSGTGYNMGRLSPTQAVVVTFQATVNSTATEGQVVENFAQANSTQHPELVACAVPLTVHVPVVTCTGTIGDFVWNDSNGNGIQDSGEAGIAGVTVTLKSAGGTVIATTTTDSNGIYHFNNLCAATYIVEVSTPSGYTSTTANASGSTTSNDSNPSPSTVILTANNSVDVTLDFGFKQGTVAGASTCSLTKKIKLPNGSEQVSVSSSDHIYASGEQIIYRLFISNTGNADANPVSISDFLPPYLYWVSGDGGYAAGDNKVNFDLGTLKAGESKTLTYNVKVRDNIPSGQVNQTNSAKVTSPSSFNNCTSSSTLVIGKPGAVLAAATLPQTGSVPVSVLATLGLVATGLVVRLKRAKLYKYR